MKNFKRPKNSYENNLPKALRELYNINYNDIIFKHSLDNMKITTMNNEIKITLPASLVSFLS